MQEIAEMFGYHSTMDRAAWLTTVLVCEPIWAAVSVDMALDSATG